MLGLPHITLGREVVFKSLTQPLIAGKKGAKRSRANPCRVGRSTITSYGLVEALGLEIL
jgi:hypothetical protein